MADIIDFELRRANSKNLFELDDPCTQCRQVSFCVNTCDYASRWWEEFGKKFRKRCTMHKLGVSHGE